MWFALGIISLLIVVGLLLTYWFPSNLVREELEVRLSELLHGIVTIHSLSFNALTGLHVRDLEFRKPNQSPLTFDRLSLDYSLLGLLTGTLTINEVTIEKANISLNLPELTQGSPADEPVPPSIKPTSLPTVPLSIDLSTLSILDSQIHVILSPDLQVALAHVNLRSSGSLSPEEANLEGQLTIDQLGLDFQDKQLQLPLDIIFKTHIDLAAQDLHLKELTVVSDPAWRMTLSGTVHDFFTQDTIQLSLTNTQFHLESLMKLAHEFVPPEWASATIQGSLSPTFTINGSLPDAQFLGTIQAGLLAQGLQVHLPSLAVDLGPTSLDIQATDIRVNNNQPTEGTLSVTSTIQDLTFQTYRIEDLDLVLASNARTSGPFSGVLNVSGTTTIPPDIVGPSFTLPFNLTLDTKGNHHTRETHINNLDVDLGPYGSLQAKAKIVPHSPQSPDMDASLELRVRPRLRALISLLPQDQLQGLVVDASPKPESLLLRARGLLHKDFKPQWATVTAALKLAPIKATWDKIGVAGDLDSLTFLVSSKYQEQEGAFRGTIGFSTKLSNLHAVDRARLDATHVVLKSSFQGNVSPTFQPVNFRSQDRLQVTLRNIVYADSSLTATLPSLKVSLDTTEDLIKQDFILKRLTVVSEDILDLRMRGRFAQATQQFTIDLHAPLLHVGNVLSHLSGPLMNEMTRINPKGWLGLSLQTAGRIPTKTDLEQFTLPLELKSTLTLHDLAGAVAGYQIQNGNGTVAFGYSPNASPQTQLTTQIHIDHIGLPSTLPIHELQDTALQLNMSSPDLNEVHIDPIRVTSQGVELSTQAVLVGLREFFSSSPSPRGTQFAKLFVQLHTQLGLDLEPFQEALQTYGVSGRGSAQVEIHLHKREHGDVSASVRVNAEKLSVVHNGTEFKDMNGGLQIKKTLHWDAGGLKTPSQKNFLPSDHIAQLKMFSEKGQRITIDQFTLGPLTIDHLSTHVAFQQQTLRIQNLAMNILGGGIGGNMAMTIEHPLHLAADFEMANLDVNQLLKKNNQISGDSKIAATLTLDALFQDKTGAIDLSRLACRVDITHIGKEALDRLLVFLDPEGSNPTLSNARAQLQLANPSLVHIDIARGQLNLLIEFQGSLIPTFELNRVPIAKMKYIEKLTAAIPNWKTLVPLMNMIGAETYSFSPEGELIMQ